MNDEQFEKLIWQELKKRGVTLGDMINLPGSGVDPTPEDTTTQPNQRVRQNKFTQTLGSERMKELLCKGKYSPYEPFPVLKVQFQDLFRFWWNNCVEQDLVLDEVLEDIYTYFTEKMRPPQKGQKQMDMAMDFDQLRLFSSDVERAA